MKSKYIFLNSIIIFNIFNSININGAINKFKQNGIYPYSEKNHEKEVLKIAKDNITRLASVYRFDEEEYQMIMDNYIIPTLKNKKYNPQVYIHEGKPVGFITYSTYLPWFRKFFNLDKFGPNAEIHHLAVAKKFRNNGFGKVLLEHALKNLKNSSVNRVKLRTTGGGTLSNLEDFYAKFGFNAVKRSKLHEMELALRLKPHPIKIIAKDILKFMLRK